MGWDQTENAYFFMTVGILAVLGYLTVSVSARNRILISKIDKTFFLLSIKYYMFPFLYFEIKHFIFSGLIEETGATYNPLNWRLR